MTKGRTKKVKNPDTRPRFITIPLDLKNFASRHAFITFVVILMLVYFGIKKVYDTYADWMVGRAMTSTAVTLEENGFTVDRQRTCGYDESWKFESRYVCGNSLNAKKSYSDPDYNSVISALIGLASSNESLSGMDDLKDRIEDEGDELRSHVGVDVKRTDRGCSVNISLNKQSGPSGNEARITLYCSDNIWIGAFNIY